MPKPCPVCVPQTLPPDLQPYWNILDDLTKAKGFAWAEVPWLMLRWGVKRWKVYEILKKLQEFGRLVVERFPKSHKRKLFTFFEPVFKRKSNENQTKKSDTLYSLKYSSNIKQTTTQLTKTETVTVPASVGCSLASQKEKDNAPIGDSPQFKENTPFSEQATSAAIDATRTGAGGPQDDSTAFGGVDMAATVLRPTQAPRRGIAAKPLSGCSVRVGIESLRENTPAPLDLPAAAAQLVEEGKVKAKIVLRHIRRAGREIVDIACCAIIEHSQKKAIESYEKALWSAVHDEWEPSEGFILPYRRGVVSADYVKPAPDAPASCWPGAKPDAIHRREYSRNHETGKDEPVSGKCRGLITRMVNWTYRSSRGMSDNEWFDVARSVVRSGSYLHLPMDWEAPRVEGGKA